MQSRRWLALPVLGAALALSACGGPELGDVEGQVLAMRSASEQPVLTRDVSVVIAGNGLDCGKRSDVCVARTDSSGKYGFKDVPAGSYAIAFNAPATGEVKLQEETRQFSVSRDAVETVSVVLLAEGMARPEVPAELAQRAGQQGSASMSSGLMGNPFFWYFMFNQPWLGGYSRPPVVVVNSDRTVTADRTQPAQNASSSSGRKYSSYGPSGAPGTKPAPVAVDSKGVTRPGTAALPGGGTGNNPALSDSSRGVTRPGQAPSTGSTSGSSGSGASSGSSGSGGSVRAPQQAPPRVGAGGGSTAGRSSPPRVRSGRR